MRAIPAVLAAAALLAPRPSLGREKPAPKPEARADNGVPSPPTRDPPPPPSRLPTPPQEGPDWMPIAPGRHTLDGRWVYTTLLGWLWAPRGRAYDDYPKGGQPHAFVYLPPNGWQWIVAPWAWGNWWPYRHRNTGAAGGDWQGASLDEWRHRNTPPPSSSFDDDDPFGDDDGAFSFGDYGPSSFEGTDWEDSSDGFGDLDFTMGDTGAGDEVFSTTRGGRSGWPYDIGDNGVGE
ncbi:MAG: hypothetical protein ACYDCL_08220 [Myxococcales bacterium]